MPQILPPAPTTYIDPTTGLVNANGTVAFYVPGTTTPKTTWTTEQLTTPNANPVQLNANGQPESGGIWGTGAYRQQVFDSNGVLLNDEVTTCWPDPFTVAAPAVTTGTNTLVLTPTTEVQPSGALAYDDYITITSPAAGANTSTSVSANWNGLGAEKVYLDTSTGPTAVIPEGLLAAGNMFEYIFDQALNGGAGGFHIDGPGLAAYFANNIDDAITVIEGDITTINSEISVLQSLESTYDTAAGGSQLGNWSWITVSANAPLTGTIAILFGSADSITAGQNLAVPFPITFASAGWVAAAVIRGETAATEPCRIWDEMENSGVITNDGASTVNASFIIIGLL